MLGFCPCGLAEYVGNVCIQCYCSTKTVYQIWCGQWQETLRGNDVIHRMVGLATGRVYTAHEDLNIDREGTIYYPNYMRKKHTFLHKSSLLEGLPNTQHFIWYHDLPVYFATYLRSYITQCLLKNKSLQHLYNHNNKRSHQNNNSKQSLLPNNYCTPFFICHRTSIV